MAPLLSRLISNIGGGAVGGTRRRNSILPFNAIGGTITTQLGSNSITYKIHTFTSPGILTVTSSDPSYVIRVDAVAAGGNGGNACFQQGGGGGGSGLVGYFSNVGFFISGNYPVTVGASGAAQPPGCVNGSGGNNTFINSVPGSTLIRVGGGGGGGTGSGGSPPGNGGSGGSTITYSAPTTLLWSYSSNGTAGQNNNPGGDNPGGGGGNAWGSPNYNSSNILFPSPFATSGYGNGGGGGGFFQPGGQAPFETNGSIGNQGAIRIYYPIAYT
jgi:hypothetical protein